MLKRLDEDERRKLFDFLFSSFRVPKRSKVVKKYDQFNNTISELKSELENFMFTQNPSLSNEALKIFYGNTPPDPDKLFDKSKDSALRHTNVQRVGTVAQATTQSRDQDAIGSTPKSQDLS